MRVHFFFSQIIVNYVFKNVHEIKYNNIHIAPLPFTAVLRCHRLLFYDSQIYSSVFVYDIFVELVRGSKELSYKVKRYTYKF